MKKLSLLFCSLILLGQFLHAQISTEKLDHYFQLLNENNKFSGSVALAKNGNILYEKSVGFSDYQDGKEINSETKFRIGSISKTFTAALVLKAIEEKKLDLNQSLNKFYPTIKNADKISIENLLNHRSGIHNFTSLPDYLETSVTAKSKKELIDLIANLQSDFEPNSKSEYSNSNYVVLSFILEDVYKKPYSTILNERIIQPLGLKNTQYGQKINPDKNEALSYSLLDNYTLSPETDLSIPMGAGGIVSTPTDLIRFGEALFGNKIISEDSVKKMKTMTDDFGLGIFQFPFYEKIAYGHTGGIDSFSSLWGKFPIEDISIAITSNGGSYSNNDITIALLSEIFGKEWELPSFETVNLSVKELQAYEGIYSSPTLPLKINVFIKDNMLYAQATGQGEFALEAKSKTEFHFDMAGIVMIFDENGDGFTLKQGGGQYEFSKE